MERRGGLERVADLLGRVVDVRAQEITVALGSFITFALVRLLPGDPAQLDSTLLYFVSPASEFVTGSVAKVDDGQSSR